MKKKTNSAAKVSVIVPIYNVEQYLPKCLDSLLNQTFKDIEILAISDGSPDNSVDIIKKYAKKDSRIKCIEKENGGYGSVLEYAIKNINTEYFLICDPDDWLADNAIEILYQKAMEKKLDIVVGDKYLVYNDGEEVYCHSVYDNVNICANTLYSDNIGELAFLHASPHAKLYRTSLAKSIKFPHKVSFTDYLLYILFLNNASRGMYIDQALSYYLCERPNNSMTDVNPKVFDYHIIVFSSVLNQLKGISVKEEIYGFLYLQFRSIVISLKEKANKDTQKEYKSKIKDLLVQLMPYKKEIIRNTNYQGMKSKLYIWFLLNPVTQNYFYERLFK